MAQKKSFKDNPALQFISAAPQEDAEPAAAEPAPGSRTATQVPEGYKINPLYIEKRDRRHQLLITRSTAEWLRTESIRSGRSMNDIINQAIEDYIAKVNAEV